MYELFLHFICAIKKISVIFLALFIFGACDTLSSDFEPGGKPEIKFINPDAEVVIGSVLNIRERGFGLVGCGERNQEVAIKVDALKWMVDEINKKLWSGTSANVSLGLYVMDSCGRTRTVASQLVEFLPELQSSEIAENRLPFKFCIIDDVGLRNEVDIYKSLSDINVPVIETNVNINSGQVLINAVLLFIQQLQLERVSIVHSNSKFSLHALKHLTKFLKKFDLCVPWVLNVAEEDDGEMQMVMDSKIPILSLLATEEHYLLLNRLNISHQFHKKRPVIFLDLVSREQLKMIPANSNQIYSVIQYPEKEINFENFYSKNSISNGIRTEDELDLVERTKTVRKIKQIGEKLSEVLKNATEKMCLGNERLCPSLLGAEGRKYISKSLAKLDWTNNELSYQLIEYQFQFSDGHIHLHKIMAFNGHKNLDIFENVVVPLNIDCDTEREPIVECRCLEVNTARIGSARNIDDWKKKKQRPLKNNFMPAKNTSSQDVDHFLRTPMVYGALNDPINGTLACLTLLGGLVTLIIAQYFATFAALPHGGLTTGTSVIGYIILFGLFMLFSTNLSFLLTPLISICAIRRFGINVSYSMIFSGMLIKVWFSLRLIKSEKPKISKPFTLLSYSAAFTILQVFLSALWLILKPPNVEFSSGHWSCYSTNGLDSHLIISMIYPLLLLLATIVLGIRTCSKSNNDETRWILISSFLVAIIISCWGVAIGTGVWQVHRTACTNLAAGTILLICLYIPKIKKHTKLKKTTNSPLNSSQISSDVKECPVFTTSPQIPIMLGYNMVNPTQTLADDAIDSSYLNQAYSVDENSETASSPFELESSSYSEVDQESYKFSTFVDEPHILNLHDNNMFNDPTQIVPSTLYPLDMFNNEPMIITSDHCQPGSNEFTPPHRAASQLYLCPHTQWIS